MQRRGKTLGAIDLHVASRLRERRIVLGISRQKLAVALGLTFQQVYKYEQGKNRISAGRLYEFGEALGVPVAFFFEDIAGSFPAAALVSGGHKDPLAVRKTAELIAAYRAISNPAVRDGLGQLARALGPELNGSTAKTKSQSRRPSRRVRTDRAGGAARR